ncbi:exopolysaccharide production protein ExoZ [Gammaproteobacteria bacterium]
MVVVSSGFSSAPTGRNEMAQGNALGHLKVAYFPHVDGLRAIAILSVLLYHLNAAWLPGGFSGVDIFFVISGFIVSASVSSLDQVGLLKFMPFFYARRFQRIVPALIVCLLVTSLATAILIPPVWLSSANQDTGLYAFFGLSNFILAKNANDYFSPIAEFNPYTQTWSLGVEEQFYVVFPLLFFAWSFRRWRPTTVGLFVLMLMASLGYSAWLAHTDKTFAFYMITSRFWQLAAGVLLFQFMTQSGRRFDVAEQPTPGWFRVGALFSLLLIGYGLAVSKPETFPFPGAIPTVLGTLGLLGFLHGQGAGNPIMRFIASRPLLFIGRISYSLYLWHWPVLVLFRWTVGIDAPLHRLAAMALVFALATASYYGVEMPLRYLPALRRAPRYAVVAMGLTATGLSAWLATQINQAQASISISTITRNTRDWYPNGFDPGTAYPGCTLETTTRPVGKSYSLTYTRKHCDPPLPAAARVFAMGDSHAMNYEGLYKEYVMETGAPVTLYNNGGCPFISLMLGREGGAGCPENTQAALEDMLGKLGAGDVVLLPSLRVPRFVDPWIRYPYQQQLEQIFSVGAAQARAQAVTAAEPILRQLHAKGAQVVLEAPKPVFRSPTFRCAETYHRTNPICGEGTDINRAEMEQLREPVLKAFKQLANAVPGVGIWDPLPVLCPPGLSCSAFSPEGRPLFFDGDHLSGYGNHVLLPSFRAFVSSTRKAT